MIRHTTTGKSLDPPVIPPAKWEEAVATHLIGADLMIEALPDPRDDAAVSGIGDLSDGDRIALATLYTLRAGVEALAELVRRTEEE